MELLQHRLQFLGDRQAKVASVLDETDPFVGHVEKDDRSPQYRSAADDLRVNDVADADNGEDQHLLEDAFEAHGRGQPLVDNGAHDAGDVVDHHKRKQCVKQAVTTSQEPSEPTADGSKGDLNGCPKFLHRDFLL